MNNFVFFITEQPGDVMINLIITDLNQNNFITIIEGLEKGRKVFSKAKESECDFIIMDLTNCQNPSEYWKLCESIVNKWKKSHGKNVHSIFILDKSQEGSPLHLSAGHQGVHCHFLGDQTSRLLSKLNALLTINDIRPHIENIKSLIQKYETRHTHMKLWFYLTFVFTFITFTLFTISVGIAIFKENFTWINAIVGAASGIITALLGWLVKQQASLNKDDEKSLIKIERLGQKYQENYGRIHYDVSGKWEYFVYGHDRKYKHYGRCIIRQSLSRIVLNGERIKTQNRDTLQASWCDNSRMHEEGPIKWYSTWGEIGNDSKIRIEYDIHLPIDDKYSRVVAYCIFEPEINDSDTDVKCLNGKYYHLEGNVYGFIQFNKIDDAKYESIFNIDEFPQNSSNLKTVKLDQIVQHGNVSGVAD